MSDWPEYNLADRQPRMDQWVLVKPKADRWPGDEPYIVMQWIVTPEFACDGRDIDEDDDHVFFLDMGVTWVALSGRDVKSWRPLPGVADG